MENTKNYEWKMPSFAKGLSASDAVKELERIETIYGAINTANVLKEASNPDNLFHRCFEWDDTNAAHKWRLEQARKLLNNINVVIVSDGEEKHIGAYEVVQVGESRQFKNIEVMDSTDFEYIRKNTLAELGQIKNKLEFYSNFKKAAKKIGQAITHLSEVVK